MGGIRRQEVTARLEREAFSAHGGRHHRFAHRERFENLDARAAARAKRHNVYARRANGGTHVIDGPCDLDAGPPGEIPNAGPWVAADDRE